MQNFSTADFLLIFLPAFAFAFDGYLLWDRVLCYISFWKSVSKAKKRKYQYRVTSQYKHNTLKVLCLGIQYCQYIFS